MALVRKAPLCLFLLASVACFGQGRHHEGKESGHHHGKSNPPPALVEQPAPKPQPPATSSLPPSAPQVSYRNGLLTVVANNSTLGDILSAVQAKTGASIDYATGPAQDRVIASYGPAPATQVLASLLNGSRFDYILLGSPGRPDLLSKAILTSKEKEAPTASASAAVAPAPARPQPADEDADTADDTAVEQPPAEQPPPPPQQPAPQAGPQYPGGQGQAKTPEQLLQELQQLQQRNQQNQQQPNGGLQPAPNPPEQ
jgi:hypothetical protein